MWPNLLRSLNKILQICNEQCHSQHKTAHHNWYCSCLIRNSIYFSLLFTDALFKLESVFDMLRVLSGCLENEVAFELLYALIYPNRR